LVICSQNIFLEIKKVLFCLRKICPWDCVRGGFCPRFVRNKQQRRRPITRARGSSSYNQCSFILTTAIDLSFPCSCAAPADDEVALAFWTILHFSKPDRRNNSNRLVVLFAENCSWSVMRVWQQDRLSRARQ